MKNLWIEGSLGFWERSDITLPKLTTTGQNADNAARQIGKIKKFSADFEVKHYMKNGSYVKLGVLYANHRMKISVSRDTIKTADSTTRIGVSLTGQDHDLVPATAQAEESETQAQARLTNFKSTETFINTGAGIVQKTGGEEKNPTATNPLVFLQKFNPIQPIVTLGHEFTSSSEDIKFGLALKLAYTGLGKINYDSGGRAHAGEKYEALPTNIIDKLEKTYTKDFRKRAAKKQYIANASGITAALEISIGMEF